MTDPIKAKRATVPIGSIEVDGFQLPDGAYRMSLSQASEVVDLSPRNHSRFLALKDHQTFTIVIPIIKFKATQLKSDEIVPLLLTRQ